MHRFNYGQNIRKFIEGRYSNFQTSQEQLGRNEWLH